MFGNYSFDGNSKYERDPALLKMERDVFHSLSEIAEQFEPIEESNSNNIGHVRIVSFEEALRELLSMNKKN